MQRWLALLTAMVVGIALLFQQGYLIETAPTSKNNAKVFSDLSRAAGVANNRAVSLDMTIGQAWGGYDKDGFLNLHIANWSCYPKCERFIIRLYR